jgi:hypothetical protein
MTRTLLGALLLAALLCGAGWLHLMQREEDYESELDQASLSIEARLETSPRPRP